MPGKKKKGIKSEKAGKKGKKDTAEKSKALKSTVLKETGNKTIKRRKEKKKEEFETVPETHPLEQFGVIRKAFILNHIRTICYRDMAKLLGIKHDKLKASVEKMGVKLPIERARKWSDIDVDQYRSLSDCARCQVQLFHSSFYVGVNNCRKCYEKNIKYWLRENIHINLRFSGE